MDNPVCFSLNVNVCAPILVTVCIGEQTGGELLEVLYHKNGLQDFPLTTNISTLGFIFMIKTYSESKMILEMSSVTSN